MHEWALAEAVLKSAAEIARKESISEVSEAVIRLGELQQIDRAVFAQGWETLRPPFGKLLAKSLLKIETEKAGFTCRACQRHWDLAAGQKKLGAEEAEAVHFIPEMAHAFLRCPACGSPDFSVDKGRGVWLVSVSGRSGGKTDR